MLTKATPEGARDYLVPSRTHPGKFFALPQSPQIFKQLLMMAGMDRYYQIVRCFRDEDLRADRQPEFTQLDVETSFLSAGADHAAHGGAGAHAVRSRCSACSCRSPFPRMSYHEAMRRFGSDKPDLRVPLELGRRRGSGAPLRLQGIRAAGAGSRRPRRGVARAGRRRARRARRSMITRPSSPATAPKGSAYIKVNERARGRDGLQSPIVKFLDDAAIEGVLARCGAADNDLIFFGADKAGSSAMRSARCGSSSRRIAGCSRPAGSRSGWWTSRCSNGMRTRGAGSAMHHPFTSPQSDDPAALRAAPAQALARAYDMVLNGSEIGGGSVRIFREEMQSAVFELLGISASEEARRSSASCSMRCATAARRTAASPSASIGWRC